MSQAVRREDRPVRLVGALAVACCALGGCSADLDRWKTTSFGSGYGVAQAPSAPVAEKMAERPAPAYTASRASETYQLRQEVKQDLGGNRQNVNAGYLQVARVDLPPLQNNGTATADAGRKQYADGYGRYNTPPLADGEYAGPRVVAPYYGPRDGNPPPPPPADWKPGGDDAPPAYRDRPYDDRFPRGGTYEPVPERRYGALPPPPPPPPPGKYDDRLPRGYDGPYGRDSYRGPGGYERLSGPYGGPAPVIPLNEGQEKHAIGEKDFIGRPSDPVAGDRGNGKVVTLRHGETIEDLADRYGVSPELIAKANNLNGSYPRPGQDLLIPVPGGVSFVNVSPGIIKPTKEVCEKGGCYTVKSGDTPLSIAKAHNIQVKALLEMNGIKEARELKAGRTIVIPGVVAAPAPQPVAAPVQQPREVPGKATIAAKEERPAQAVERQQAPAERKVAEAPVPVDIPAPVQEQAKPMQAAIQDGDGNCEASLLNPLPRTGQNFRMPVEGRVITSFGKQKDNSVSEGIAISVPKGTPIKASENGVVAYVGNELAGFGNLILIKHADDYVTAYANADEVLVKRCQVVKRGETIAKAGTSGGVPQPQVHFEIRKGAKPVDPQTLASS